MRNNSFLSTALQTVSVSVSVLTLTFISVDRWYAICHPLKFRSTIGRAKTAIAAIWIISLLIGIKSIPTLSVEMCVIVRHLTLQTSRSWSFWRRARARRSR